LIEDFPSFILSIYNPSFLLIPDPYELLNCLASLFKLWIKDVTRPFSVPVDEVVVSWKMIDVALKLVVVIPNNLINEPVPAKHFIKHSLGIVGYMPIKMDKDASVGR